MLEIGAGRTYPQLSQGIRPINLARRIASVASTFDASVTCADYIGRDEKAIFFRQEDGRLSSVGFPVVLPGAPESRIEKTGGSFPRLVPLSNDDAGIVLARLEAAELPVEAHRHERPRAEVFCRPALDPELEKVVFGIECVLGCNFFDLRQFKGGDFDLVWGTGLLPPRDSDKKEQMKAAVARILKPDGEALIHLVGQGLLRGLKGDSGVEWREEFRR